MKVLSVGVNQTLTHAIAGGYSTVREPNAAIRAGWRAKGPADMPLVLQGSETIVTLCADAMPQIEPTAASVTPNLIKSRHASLSLSDSRSLRDESLADSLLSTATYLWTVANPIYDRAPGHYVHGTVVNVTTDSGGRGGGSGRAKPTKTSRRPTPRCITSWSSSASCWPPSCRL